MPNIIGWILLVVLLFIAFYALLNIIKLMIMFHARRCKHCGHVMEFKKHNAVGKEETFDFHCTHCGAWERVSKQEMLEGGTYYE